jgi:hypothetical protein
MTIMTHPKINIIDVGSVGGYDSPWNNHTIYIDWSLNFEPNRHLQKLESLV